MHNYSQRDIFFAGESVVIFKKTTSNQEEVPPHTHDFIELVYVCSGEAAQAVDSKTKNVGRGELVCIHPGQVHESHNIVKTTYIEILIKPEIMNTAMSQLHINPAYYLSNPKIILPFTVISKNNIYFIESLISNMLTEYKNKAPGYQDILYNSICILISLIIRQSEAHTSKINRISKEVIDYIDAHFREDLTLEMLAEKNYLSPKYFSHLFKKTFDMTLTEYIHRKRITEGQHLLINTDLSISAISESLGWKNDNYFYNKFKKICHITPHEYRKNNR